MSQELKAMATEVAEDLHKTGILTEILIGAELIYYIYKLFTMCYPSQESAKSYLRGEYDGENFSKRVMRPAVRQTMKAARHKRVELTDEQIEAVAKASLLKAMNADDNVVAACYSSAE